LKLVFDNVRSLWSFALELYDADGVQEACLALQDEYGANVNLLLFGAWMAVTRGVAFTGDDAQSAQALVRDWDQEIVRPLRAVRRKLKTGPAPAPPPATETLRNAIKDAELSSERISLAVLEAHAVAWPAPARAAPNALETNLQRVLELTASPDGVRQAAPLLAAIAGAIARH